MKERRINLIQMTHAFAAAMFVITWPFTGLIQALYIAIMVGGIFFITTHPLAIIAACMNAERRPKGLKEWFDTLSEIVVGPLSVLGSYAILTRWAVNIGNEWILYNALLAIVVSLLLSYHGFAELVFTPEDLQETKEEI